MTLDNNFSIILKKIIKDEKASDLMFNYLKKLKRKEKLDDIIVIFLIKSILLVISYYPHKIKKLLNFFRVLVQTKNESKKDFICSLKKLGDLEAFIIKKNDDNEEKIFISDTSSFDYYLDKVIFKTFLFIDFVMDLNEELIVTLLAELAVNTMKINTFDPTLKLRLFLLFIKDSTNIIKKSQNQQIYIKIVELCANTTKIINNYLS